MWTLYHSWPLFTFQVYIINTYTYHVDNGRTVTVKSDQGCLTGTCSAMKSTVIILVLFHLGGVFPANTCKKVNSCKCELDDGKVINLEPVAKSNGAA